MLGDECNGEDVGGIRSVSTHSHFIHLQHICHYTVASGVLMLEVWDDL